MLKTKRICLWSGPRNISTELMYSFAQREDSTVFDEPFYAHYLAHTKSNGYHPGADEILESQQNDGQKVIDEIILGDYDTPIAFFQEYDAPSGESGSEFYEGNGQCDANTTSKRYAGNVCKAGQKTYYAKCGVRKTDRDCEVSPIYKQSSNYCGCQRHFAISAISVKGVMWNAGHSF
jgi:hypothetical protein